MSAAKLSLLKGAARLGVVAVALELVLAGGALAAATLGGAVATPLTLDRATLSSFPASEVKVALATARGTDRATYTGVLLWDLLRKAAPVNDTGTNAALRHTLVVTAADGYAVDLALAELDPDYGNRRVLLAFRSTDGAATFNHPRLIVPGDVRAGRSVRDVVSIEVK